MSKSKSSGSGNTQSPASSQKHSTPTGNSGAGQTFLASIWHHRQNKLIFLGSLLINILLLILYKYCLPLPDFFTDCNGYIYAAAKGVDVYYRPAGYAYFLSFMHAFSSSDVFLVVVQFLLLLFSAQFLYFSVLYLFRLSKPWLKYLLAMLVLINPVFLVLSNQAGSDTAFTAFSIIWFTAILWMLKKQSWWALLLQLAMLYFSFQIRYNAMYYPFMLVAVLLLVKGLKVYYKAAAILLSSLVIFSSYNKIKNTTEEATGADVFEGFSGWMLANNALLIYPHAENKISNTDDPDQKALSQFVERYIDSISPESKAELDRYKIAWPYMWDRNGPLKQFLFYYIGTRRVPYINGWYQVSPILKEYGKQMILNNPGAYFKHYALINIGYFFAPLKIDMARYVNDGSFDVPVDTKEWFGWSIDRLWSRYPAVQTAITNLYFPLHVFVMILSCLTLIAYLYLFLKKKDDTELRGAFLLFLIFWLATAAFGIVAGPIVLRYQLGLFVISSVFSALLIDRMLLVYGKAKTPAIEQ